MPQAFVHLHLHSEFSLVDSTLRLKELVARAKELGMPAVAVTDQFNMFALVKFYRAAMAAGIINSLGSIPAAPAAKPVAIAASGAPGSNQVLMVSMGKSRNGMGFKISQYAPRSSTFLT